MCLCYFVQLVSLTIPTAFFIVHFLVSRNKTDFIQAILGVLSVYLSVCLLLCLSELNVLCNSTHSMISLLATYTPLCSLHCTHVTYIPLAGLSLSILLTCLVSNVIKICVGRYTSCCTYTSMSSRLTPPLCVGHDLTSLLAVFPEERRHCSALSAMAPQPLCSRDSRASPVDTAHVRHGGGGGRGSTRGAHFQLENTSATSTA